MLEYEGKYLVKAPGDYYYKGEDASGFNYTREPIEALIFKDKESAEQLAYSLNNIANGLSQHIVGEDIYYEVVSMSREMMFRRSMHGYERGGQRLTF